MYQYGNDFYLEMGNEDPNDWNNIIRLTIKKNEYRFNKTDFFTMISLLGGFGAFFAIVNKLFNFGTT